jgi:putative oxidoreductase
MDFEDRLRAYQPQMLSIMRIMFGLLFLSHGLQKWFAFPVPMPGGANTNVTLFSMLGAAGIIEIVCGTLVALGLFTRYAAIIISGQMAVAYFYYANRLSRGFMPIQNGGTLDVAYCFAFLYLGFAGGGPWSLDSMWRKKP